MADSAPSGPATTGAGPGRPAVSRGATAPKQAPKSPGGSAAARRDPRLDVLRGLALVMIFINHVPGNAYEAFTNRNFGFSDAAEGFVFMSGVAAALAYGPRLAQGFSWQGVKRPWRRAWTLYLVHLAGTVIALGISAAGALWLGTEAMVQENNVATLIDDPLRGWIGLAVLSHQLGYMNILPIYALLLMATPLLLVAAWRVPRTLLAASIVAWLGAGAWRIGLPTWPVESIWFFNPLSWQLLFVLGLLTGIAAKGGRAFVAATPARIAVAAAIVAVILLWAQWDALGARLNEVMFSLRDTAAPDFLFDYDKTFVSGPRLVHFLALAYLLSALPQVRAACASRWAEPLATLGRHGLTVFALGTVLAFAAQVAKARAVALGVEGLDLDTAVIAAGLGIQYLVARVKETSARRRRAEQARMRAALAANR
ncbi:OpgC family protein [Frigidibacter sp. MR17.24]|uniref:OpgC family protein n=1 Tax=Frigidibacter sp. MR17.24 TaxID=3127345 RepID=UPI00301313BD